MISQCLIAKGIAIDVHPLRLRRVISVQILAQNVTRCSTKPDLAACAVLPLGCAKSTFQKEPTQRTQSIHITVSFIIFVGHKLTQKKMGQSFNKNIESNMYII